MRMRSWELCVGRVFRLAAIRLKPSARESEDAEGAPTQTLDSF